MNVRILEVDADRRRLSLSLKRVEDGMPVQPMPGEEGEPPALGLSDEVFADEAPAAEALEAPAEEEPAAAAEDEPKSSSSGKSLPARPELIEAEVVEEEPAAEADVVEEEPVAEEEPAAEPELEQRPR